jgi:hypothetical protein
VEFRGFPELDAALLKESRTRGSFQNCVQEIRGISLVFREMWDSTALAPSSHSKADLFLRRPGFFRATTAIIETKPGAANEASITVNPAKTAIRTSGYPYVTTAALRDPVG